MIKHAKLMSVIFTLLLFASLAQAQNDKAPSKSNDDIAKELANPNTTLGTMAFPIDFIKYNGTLPDAGNQFGMVLNFQPSLPIPLSQGLNLFVRPLIPIYLTQPAYGPNGFEQKGINLGNISADVAVGKTWSSKTITILGVFGGFPTATDKALRSKSTTIGPELMVAQLFSWGAIGALFNHAWSVNSNVPSSVTAGQYFYVVSLKNAWQITGQPTWAYNHLAEKGNKFTFPIGTGVNKVFRLGKLPVKLSLQYWYYLARPDEFGPQHQIRLQIAPVVPLPW